VEEVQMRIPRWAGLLALAVLAFWLGHGSSNLSAQQVVPDGVFVRSSDGTDWLVIGGQRAKVPFFPAVDDVINSIPDSGQFVVAGEGGALALGGQPDYVNQAPVTMAEATATPTVSEDPPPTVNLQVDDDRIQVGQTISVTLIADDNNGIDWIQWEGTIQEEDDNDNKATGDADLDAEHRHDCDGQKQCAFVWQITPQTPGRFVLRARGRDNAGNRSEWVTMDLRVTGSAATATPTATPLPAPEKQDVPVPGSIPAPNGPAPAPGGSPTP
jgi:hypothetical protein